MTCIILEGPDGAGKSTLAAAFERRLIGRGVATTVVKSQHGPYLGEDDIAGHYLDDLASAWAVRHTGAAWLLDRSWISEAIYGPLVRNSNRIDVARRRALERVGLAVGAAVVLCLPPYETCLGAYLTRKQLEYLPSESLLKQVYDGYQTYGTDQLFPASRGGLPTYFYNRTEETHRGTFIESLMYDLYRQPPNMGPGVGNFAPGEVTLLVGDQVNVNTAAAHLPFISWHPGGCAGWLSRQLEEWGVEERELYWVNANGLDGRPISPHGWFDMLAPKKIVALGAAANDWCNWHKIPCVAVAHPQNHKRFSFEKPYPLREILRP